jgi:chromosomal replication initiation ATPase DnaA
MNYFEATLTVLCERGVTNALEICNEIEGKLNEENNKPKIDKEFYFEAALNACNRYYPSVTATAVKSQQRHQKIVTVRQIVCYLMRENAKLTFNDIGLMLGGRHHSTQIYAVRKVNDIMSYDKRFANMVVDIKNSFASTVYNAN